jgi:hypothetical protein
LENEHYPGEKAVPHSINTDQFSSPVFRPHGRVVYGDRGNLLWAEAVGPFNRELMAAVLEIAQITFPAMTAKGQWAHLCTFSESALCSPDVLADLANALGQMVQAGVAPKVMAFVLPVDVEGSALMAQLFEQALLHIGVPFRCFAEVDAANLWLASFVAPLSTAVDP